MKFFTFRQNNSGGYFHTDADVNVYVIIQAENAYQATIKAEEIGIYFNGCSKEIDCYCCGDRWSDVDDDDCTDVPIVYDIPVTVEVGADDADTVVHYADGGRKYFTSPDYWNSWTT